MVNGRYRVTYPAIARITRGLLVVVLGEAFSCTEIAQLRRRGQLTGRLSVDVAVDQAVDQTSVQSEQ